MATRVDNGRGTTTGEGSASNNANVKGNTATLNIYIGGVFGVLSIMNKKLAKKMAVISRHFQEAGVDLPVAKKRTGLMPVRYAGKKGVTVNGRAIWGVTPREYWKFCKAQTK